MQQIYELNYLLLSYEVAADATTARKAEHADDGTYQTFFCRFLPFAVLSLHPSWPRKRSAWLSAWKKKTQACWPHLHFINYLAEGIKIDLDGRENKSASRLLGHGVKVRTWVWITIRDGCDIRCQQSLVSSQQRRHTQREECDTRGAF